MPAQIQQANSWGKFTMVSEFFNNHCKGELFWPNMKMTDQDKNDDVEIMNIYLSN